MFIQIQEEQNMSAYPGGIDQFSRKTDNVDTILANDINELQSSIESVETELGTDPSGSFTTVKARLDDLDSQLDNITVIDSNVNLSEGNVGDNSTLEEHVKDVAIHGNTDVIACNYQKMLEATMDQALRGVLASGYPLNSASVDITTAFPLETGDIVFCYPSSNPSASGYGWHIVTTGCESLTDGQLRLDGSASAPSFADSSRITKLKPFETFAADFSGEIELEAGSFIFAYPTSNPAASSYGWFMATASASSVSEIRLNDETSAPVFAAGSRISVFESSASAVSTDTGLQITAGDIVFCYPSSNPTSSGYGWHLVTAGTTTGVSGTDLRLDNSASAPVFTGTRFSKFPVTGTALVTDTSLPLNQGELAFCNTSANPSSSEYGWHLVNTGSPGVSSSALRFDNASAAPVFVSGSRLSAFKSEKYQGVARGGEILEIAYIPQWVILNSVGTGTDPSSTGTFPAIYGNVSVKMPMGDNLIDRDFISSALQMTSGDPLQSSAFRPRVQPYSGAADAYFPEAGMRLQLFSNSPTERGVSGAGIINRAVFGVLCEGYPTIKAYTGKISEAAGWNCCFPMLVRVLDNADNPAIDTGDFAVLVFSTQGETDSPFITSAETDSSAIDLFKIPSESIYTGTGEDGELVVDGTYPENSTTGFSYPGGQLVSPSGFTTADFGTGTFASGIDVYYRVSAVDSYSKETAATVRFVHHTTASGTGIKITWTAIPGAAAYNIYGRFFSESLFLRQVTTAEYIDTNSDIPNPNKSYPVTNETNASFLIDTIKNYTNVTVQNGGVISCSDWNYSSQAYGKLVFYCKGTVLVTNLSSINANGRGYRGGAATYQGESYTGQGTQSLQRNAGGGGAGNPYYAGAGGYGTVGEDGQSQGGSVYGNPSLDILYRGSGGGGVYNSPSQYPGGSGGGIIFISADSIIIQGSGLIESNGGSEPENFGGGGSGGSIYLRANTLDTGLYNIKAIGGNQGTLHSNKGGEGRIRFDFIDRGASESVPPAYKYQI
jgi:hypothetical protein